MDKDKISYRVMKFHEFSDGSIVYRLACDCGEPDHDLFIDVEYEHGYVWANVSGNFTVADWWGFPRWPCRLWKRIKLVFKLLFTGWFEASHDMVLIDEGHIDSIISFLQVIKEKRHAEN